MAREELDREDLLREASALVPRVELSLPGSDEWIVVGFRRNGATSFFFGADPVYQFNSRGQLRRAYRDGRLVRAERHQLVEWSRQRTENEVQMLRHELTHDEQETVLRDVRSRLEELHSSLESGSFKIGRQVPTDVSPVPKILAWLQDFRGSISIAARPNAE